MTQDDPAVVVARERLADWLNSQAFAPEYGVTLDDLASWEVRPVEEFLLFAPPGFANQLFLVAGDGVTAFAPSSTSLGDAIAAARP
ncbi:hypothetical protein AB0E69_06395 [Kribbella sp. NPDC026611]|uniref:hypothetical protein n=1 Tax=Kribbella sp. NPDC026611 TaxID=3154911 RepID=UPI0034099968